MDRHLQPEAIITELFGVLGSLSAHCRENGIGTDLLVHSLKCAAYAQREGADDELVAAALLHDIGHAFCPIDDEFGELPDRDSEHAFLGQRFLETRLPQRVGRLVGGHVDAKRYLLRNAGGAADQTAMDPMEAAKFEHDPDHKALCRLRWWDWDCDSVIEHYDGLEDYRTLLLRLCARMT